MTLKSPQWYDNYIEQYDGSPLDTIVSIGDDESRYQCRFCDIELYASYHEAHEDSDGSGVNREWEHMITLHAEEIALIRLTLL